MKKLLSIIGAVSLTLIGASNIVACGAGKAKSVKQSNPPKEPQAEKKQNENADQTPVVESQAEKKQNENADQTPVVESQAEKKIILSDLKWVNFIDNFEITKDELNIIKDYKINSYNFEASKNLKNKILNFLNDNKEKLWSEIEKKNSIELKKFNLNKENFKINKIISLNLLKYNNTGNEYLVILLLLDFSNEQEKPNEHLIDIYKLIKK
ncbi:lipoprotein [Spiroplasma sp. ald]|uniref:lipoprotein n=1 Tax=Spiroplasma sp. ald TaxID=2490849 RepID=UPI0037DC211D